MVYKENVIIIIDEVMNNREIDSIRNAILAIRDKVIGLEPEYAIKLKLRCSGPLHCTGEFFEGAEFVCIDTYDKIDTGEYGAIWYE